MTEQITPKAERLTTTTHTLHLDVVSAPRRQHEVTPSCSCTWVGGTHMSADLAVARHTATAEHTDHVQATQPPTNTAVLWLSNSGRIACTRHGGAYLAAAVAARPRARTHTTPLDRWTRVTAADVAAWDAEPDLPPMSCESCPARPAV